MKPHHLLLLIVAFYGCSSNSKLTSTFGERKYTKGHFWDVPGVISKTDISNNKQVTKSAIPAAVNSREIAKALLAKNNIYPSLAKKETALKHANINKEEKKLISIKTTTLTQIIPENNKDYTPTKEEKSRSLRNIIFGIILLIIGCLFGIAAIAFYIEGTAILVPSVAVISIIALIFGIILLDKGIAY